MKARLDLNADLGEGAPAEGELLGLVSSASIACGFHSGDALTMQASIAAAEAAGVAVGAHPSFPDRENFGRAEMALPPADVFSFVIYQLGAFQAVAHSLGARPRHVKPHGALYNMAARDPALAGAVAGAIHAVDPGLWLFAPAGSALAQAGAARGLCVAREFFADRHYRKDGALVSRARPDALLHDAEEAAARVLRLLREGVVRTIDGADITIAAETICVHGDTPEAVAFAQQLRTALTVAGIKIVPPQE